jgi:hypothetical protein
MKASKKRIKVYKAYVLEPIVKHLEDVCESLSHFGCDCQPPTKERLDSLIKQRAEIDLSCIEMSLEELENVILQGRILGDMLGLDLNDLEDELDDKINLKL